MRFFGRKTITTGGKEAGGIAYVQDAVTERPVVNNRFVDFVNQNRTNFTRYNEVAGDIMQLNTYARATFSEVIDKALRPQFMGSANNPRIRTFKQRAAQMMFDIDITTNSDRFVPISEVLKAAPWTKDLSQDYLAKFDAMQKTHKDALVMMNGVLKTARKNIEISLLVHLLSRYDALVDMQSVLVDANVMKVEPEFLALIRPFFRDLGEGDLESEDGKSNLFKDIEKKWSEVARAGESPIILERFLASVAGNKAKGIIDAVRVGMNLNSVGSRNRVFTAEDAQKSLVGAPLSAWPEELRKIYFESGVSDPAALVRSIKINLAGLFSTKTNGERFIATSEAESSSKRRALSDKGDEKGSGIGTGSSDPEGQLDQEREAKISFGILKKMINGSKSRYDIEPINPEEEEVRLRQMAENAARTPQMAADFILILNALRDRRVLLDPRVVHPISNVGKTLQVSVRGAGDIKLKSVTNHALNLKFADPNSANQARIIFAVSGINTLQPTILIQGFYPTHDAYVDAYKKI